MNKIFFLSFVFLFSSLYSMEESDQCPFLHEPVLSNALLFRDIKNDAMSESVRQTLEAGIRPNITDADGITPLYAAVGASAARNVELLLQYGAEPNDNPSRLETEGKFTPLHIACSYHKDSLETKKCAARLRIVTALLNAGADPNLIDCCNTTPLFQLVSKYKGINEVIPGAKEAFIEERKKLITLLLNAGAQTTQKDMNGCTIFGRAQKIGIPELGEFIKAHQFASTIKR